MNLAITIIQKSLVIMKAVRYAALRYAKNARWDLFSLSPQKTRKP